MVGAVHLAMKGNGIGASIGKGEEQHLGAALAAKPGSPTPLLSAAYDVKRLTALGQDQMSPDEKAIVEAFDPGHTTPQLAALLFGNANNWGKLPVTIYSHNYTTGAGGLPAQDMNNYDMVKAPVSAAVASSRRGSALRR